MCILTSFEREARYTKGTSRPTDKAMAIKEKPREANNNTQNSTQKTNT